MDRAWPDADFDIETLLKGLRGGEEARILAMLRSIAQMRSASPYCFSIRSR